ncbi:MAG TPA: hypothetical protein VIF64_00510 [Pyrinomonadaceae bacterium]
MASKPSRVVPNPELHRWFNILANIPPPIQKRTLQSRLSNTVEDWEDYLDRLEELIDSEGREARVRDCVVTYREKSSEGFIRVLENLGKGHTLKQYYDSLRTGQNMYKDELRKLILTDYFENLHPSLGTAIEELTLGDLSEAAERVETAFVVDEWAQQDNSRINLFRAYSLIESVIATLRGIAGFNWSQGPFSLSNERRVTLNQGVIELSLDANGLLRISMPSFLRSIQGTDPTRIRECSICDHLFWGRRSNQQYCSQKCGKVSRTRRWREKYLTTYKRNRPG